MRKRGEIQRENRKEGSARNVNRSMTRNSVAATVISFGGFAVINECSIENRLSDDVSMTSAKTVSFRLHARYTRGGTTRLQNSMASLHREPHTLPCFIDEREKWCRFVLKLFMGGWILRIYSKESCFDDV